MNLIRTKRFQDGCFNYSIEYTQYQDMVFDEETNRETPILCHIEVVKFYKFPFLFGTNIQVGQCHDTGEYYRQ
jgi:hypothetical protein